MRVNLKDTSAERLEICLKGLEPHVGHVPVRNLTHRHCEDWLTKRGKEISASSYNHERRTLIAVLDYAVRDGLILDNPARVAVPTRKIPKPKIVIPTREQFGMLVTAIRRADVRATHAGNLVELLGYSGMRLNEAVNLKWSDTDWDRGTFTVTGGEHGTKNHEARIERAKTNPIACRVKLADLNDNLDIGRIQTLSPRDMDRLNKYKSAKATLLSQSESETAP